MVYYVAPGIIFPVLEPPYIIYRNLICKELSNNIAGRERLRAGSKQMATYQAVAQTQSSWSSSCEKTSPRCGRKQIATYQAVAQTQSRCLIAARGRPRNGSKQIATYQAVVVQTQSSSSSSNLCCSVATQTWSAHVVYSWSSSCEKTSPRCGRKQMATYQAVAQTQSRCLIAARERPRNGSKQIATYHAVVAQTQSSSSSSNLCCSVATQTWSAPVVCSLLHTIHYASSMNAVWRTPIQSRPQTALLLLLYIFSRQQHAYCASLSPSIFPTSVFFPQKINWQN